MVRVISAESSPIPTRKRPVDGVALFVEQSAMDVMLNAAEGASKQSCETLGLMVGHLCCDDCGSYATVSRMISSPLIADDVSVGFDHEGMDELIDGVDSMEECERIVGWFHSHLGCGCFMSQTDADTQHSMFGDEAGFALVIDPVKGEAAAFDNSEPPEKVRMNVI